MAADLREVMQHYFNQLTIEEKEIELTKLILISKIPKKILKRRDLFHFDTSGITERLRVFVLP